MIERRLSLHSSAGNHTVAEAVGLLYAGVLYPSHRRSQHWIDAAVALLNLELPRLINDDGGSLEQADWYLLLIVDLAGLASRTAQMHEIQLSPQFMTALNSAVTFLNSLASEPRELPCFGDADNGYALSPHLAISWGDAVPSDAVKRYAGSGVTCLFSETSTGLARLLVQHGPLGMAPGYGHGHAHALSLTLNIASNPILIDCGTGLYLGQPDWRRYFRSTPAHNTVTLGGVDQAEQQGPFLWRSPYAAEHLQQHDIDGYSAEIFKVAYASTVFNWQHLRAVVKISPTNWVVVDRLSGDCAASVEQNWHLLPKMKEFAGQECHIWRADSVFIAVSTCATGEVTSFRGGKQAGPGVYSPEYGKLADCTTIRSTRAPATDHAFVSNFGVSGDNTDGCEPKVLALGVSVLDFLKGL